MAKGKHAAALFEVIHQNKKVERVGPSRGIGLFQKPKWWGNRRSSTGAVGLGAPSSHAVSHAAPPAAREPVRVELPLQPSPVPETTPPASRERQAARRTREPRESAAFQLDRRTAILAGAGVCLVVVMAFTFGNRIGRSPTPLFSRTTDEIRTGPANPNVLDIPRTGTVQTTYRSNSTGDASPAAHINRATNSFTEPLQPATHMVVDTQRTFGLNYVVIQSYKDPKYAEDAKNLLVKNDIFCTVEKDLPFAGPGWYTVVGLTGFDRIKNVREYRSYVDAISAVGRQIPKNSRLKEFNPQPYKWR